MKTKNKLSFLLLFFLLKVTVSFAQIDTTFWFAAPWVTPDHWWKDNYVVHISTFNTPSTQVRLRQPSAIGPNKYDTTINIPANSNFDYIFWRDKLASPTNFGFDSLEVRPANTVLPYGLYISATSNVTIVYDVITRPTNFYNPETFSLKGSNGLGLEFVCPFQTKWNNQTLGGDLNGDGITTQPKQQINIVASKPNTVVWITPKCNVVGHLANVTYSILLPGYGSAYTIQNSVQNTTAAGNNLSGTIVVADKPISVTVADDSVAGVTGCFDLMGDQIVPVDVVGRNYILNKGYMNAPEPEGAYVVATKNFTKLTINDGVTTTTLMNKGDTYHYKTTQPLTYINADQNVYCLHASGTGCELGEALLPPLECAGSNLVTFSRTNNQGFYLNILCKNGSQGTFTLNNAAGTVTIPITAANFTFAPGTSTLTPGGYYGGQLNLSNIATLPIGSYTVYNPTDVFALGIFGGNASTGGLFHYLSSFLRKPVVVAQQSVQICASPTASVMLTGTVSGGASTGTWSTSVGSGAFGAYTSTSNVVSVPYFLSLADTLLSSIPFTLTATDICNNKYSDIVTVFINQRPKVQVGSGISLCKNNLMPISLTGTVSNAAGGSWSGGSGTFGSPVPNTVYNAGPGDLSAGVITLTLTSAGPNPGCLNASKTITINFVNPPVVNAGADITACTNSQSVTLNGNVSGITNTGIWTTSGTGLFNPNNATSNAVYLFSASDLSLTSITFTLSSTNNSLCAASKDYMQINIIPKPFVAAPANFTVCASAGAVVLTGTVGGSATSGNWSTSNGTGAFTASPPSSATYSLSQNDTIAGNVQFYLSSSGGICPVEKDSTKITIQKAPNITITTNSITICKNAPITLTANVVGGTSYTWVAQSSSTGSFITPGPTGALNPTLSTVFSQFSPSASDITGGGLTFTILISNPPCAPSQKTVVATFIPAPKALFSFPNIGRCLGSSIPFTNASLPNGAAPLTYSWNFGATTNSTSAESIAQNPIYTYTSLGNNGFVVTLTVTGTNNCPDTVSRRIKIYPLPIANFSVTSGCQGINTIFQNLSIVPLNGGSVTAMSWNFGDPKPNLNTGLTYTVSHIYDNAGPYNAVLTVSTNLGCTSSTLVPININPKPKAEFGMTNNPTVAQEPVYFSDFSTPTGAITNWSWNFGDELSGSGNAPTHSYANPGIFIIKLTVSDANGCSDTTSRTIEVTLLPQVPTGFSPNKDNNNDLLFVKGGPFQKMLFRIYNNWGELLFETTDQTKGWDGTKNGVEQPVGVYVWTLEADLYNNRQAKKNGDVTLIR